MRPVLLLISLGLLGCEPEPPALVLDCPVEGEAPAPTLLEVYAQLQSPICGNCHFPGSQAPDQSSPEALAALIDAGSPSYPPLKIIAPGDLRRSVMYLKVMGGTDAGYTGPSGEDTGPLMPRGGPALSEEKKALLRRWICAGAPAE